MNLLIPYIPILNHEDPLFQEFTYGDGGARARKLVTSLRKGDYVFFHTTIKGKKCITAYYMVDRVLDTSLAVKDKNIIAKYRNPHLLEFMSGKYDKHDNNVVLFGDPITSRILERPLPFDKTLARKLSLNIGFPKGRSEALCIGSATRNWRELTDKDIHVLLDEIKSYEKVGPAIEDVISTDEVAEIIEKDIEAFIERNPRILGKSLKLKRRQFDTPVGRIDLFFEDRAKNPVVVELKVGSIGRDAIRQLRRYMDWLKKETKKKPVGIIVCKGVMPAFAEDFSKLKNIKIFCYGWQLKVQEWKGNK